MTPKVSIKTLHKMRESGDKISMLTCYDASFSAVFDAEGVDILLVGDSLGMVVQGRASTLGVSMLDMAYHTQAVARCAQRALVLVDMPFGSYQTKPEDAFLNAAQLMAAGAEMVKIEGGQVMAPTIAFLVARGIPVCAHIGLLPQSVHQLGGYRVQGKTEQQAQQVLQDAQAVEQAGASLLLMEAIPAALAAQVTQQARIPTIGIGAGAQCDGQVLVCYDMLGIHTQKAPKPRFVRNFMQGQDSVQAAVRAYVHAVKAGEFPLQEHSF